jgi:hypothetical protein
MSGRRARALNAKAQAVKVVPYPLDARGVRDKDIYRPKGLGRREYLHRLRTGTLEAH